GAQGLERRPQPAPHGRRVHRRRGRGRAPRDGGQRPARALALHLGLLLRPQRVQLLAREGSVAHELLAVELGHRGMALDLGVHEGLGVARLVALVVAPAPIADEVDHHVPLEALPVLVGHRGHVHHGLGVGATLTLKVCPVSAWCTPVAPRWYFTSPDPCVESGSACPSNSEKIWPSGLPMVLARTFKRPRWAMPMIASRTPWRAASERTRSRSGIVDSQPSSEKRLWPTYLAWRKRSKLSASTTFSRTRR